MGAFFLSAGNTKLEFIALTCEMQNAELRMQNCGIISAPRAALWAVALRNAPAGAVLRK